MRILFINISDIKGGAAKSMWRIGEELSKEHEVKFLVRSKFSARDNVIEIGRNKYINILFNLFGLQYKFLPVSRKIVKQSKKFKPDVISLNQIEGGYFQTRDIIKLSKIAPIVWTMHDLWAFMGNSHRELSQGESERSVYPQIGFSVGKWLLKMKERIYDKCDFRTVLPSYYLRDVYLKSFIDKPFEVIPHGIDLDKFSPKKVKRILFVSEKTSKGLLKPILDKLDGFLKEKICLTVIGEGGLNETYKNIIIENKGYTEDEEELIWYYRDSDIFIYPTQADIFGLVLLESLACGLPAVAYNVGGIEEVIGKGGFLIKYGAVADFAFKVFALLNNERLRVELSERARTQALKFDIKRIKEDYLKIFKGMK